MKTPPDRAPPPATWFWFKFCSSSSSSLEHPERSKTEPMRASVIDFDDLPMENLAREKPKEKRPSGQSCQIGPMTPMGFGERPRRFPISREIRGGMGDPLCSRVRRLPAPDDRTPAMDRHLVGRLEHGPKPADRRRLE